MFNSKLPLIKRQIWRNWHFWGSGLFTILAGLCLFLSTWFDGLMVGIISVGLDPLRAQFVTALIMTAGAACLGALLGRQRIGALLGGGLVFVGGFLWNFVQTQLRPVYDPGGHPEPLDMGALVHTSVVMMSLGLLSAFIGAAVGGALGELVYDPLYRLARLFWQFLYRLWGRFSGRGVESSAPTAGQGTTRPAWGRGLGAAMIVGLLVLAAGSGDLFIFSPDTGIHSNAVVRDQHGHVIAGTVVSDSFVSSALNSQKRGFLVYLPPSYNTLAGKGKTYPTLYLLHGSPGHDQDWVKGGKAVASADTLIATKRIPELIMVFPDGNGFIKAPSEWGNSYDPRQQMETSVAHDLVSYVDSHYRTIPDAAHRAIGGLSMGGFGAMNIAVHHPDVFGTTISLGGYYQAEGSVWGKSTLSERQNSPLVDIRSIPLAWHLHMYLGAATQDQPYYKDTLQFMQVLNKLHVNYYFDLEKGYHSWRVWQQQMYNALTWLKW